MLVISCLTHTGFTIPKRSRSFLDEEVAAKKDKSFANAVDGDATSDDDDDVDEERQVGVFIRQIEDEILHKANVDAVVRGNVEIHQETFARRVQSRWSSEVEN